MNTHNRPVVAHPSREENQAVDRRSAPARCEIVTRIALYLSSFGRRSVSSFPFSTAQTFVSPSSDASYEPRYLAPLC